MNKVTFTRKEDQVICAMVTFWGCEIRSDVTEHCELLDLSLKDVDVPISKHVNSHKNSIVFLHEFHHKTSVKMNLKPLPWLYLSLMSVYCVENKAGTSRDKKRSARPHQKNTSQLFKEVKTSAVNTGSDRWWQWF